jgi:hypothetical protein
MASDMHFRQVSQQLKPRDSQDPDLDFGAN